MEQTIEGTIDNGLESISAQLYIFSIGLGIVLLILGAFLVIKNKGSKKKKSITNIGLICLVLGIVAIISGLMQI